MGSSNPLNLQKEKEKPKKKYNILVSSNGIDKMKTSIINKA